jgi:Ion channel
MLLPLLVGAGVLAGGLLAHGTAMALVVRLAARLIRSGGPGVGLPRAVAVLVSLVLATAAAHLIPIALWAMAYLLVGEVAAFERAFYLSAQNYVALGYGDVLLSERWRLLGPLEAGNGLLLFGLSTSVTFAVLNRLLGDRLHEGLVGPGDSTRTGKPRSGSQCHART